MPEFVNYRGPAVARRTFTLAEAGRARMVFNGASHTVRIFVDGREIGAHRNASPLRARRGRVGTVRA